MKKRLIVFCITLVACFGLQAQVELNVTYIANEGFLIESEGKKILVDGLFNIIDGDWCDSPSESTVKLMKAAKSQFADIDLVAITHKHRDHFDAEVVMAHALSNPKVIIICPEQVNGELKKLDTYPKIKSQVFAFTPELFQDINLVLAKIPIRVLRLEHSHYMEEDTINGGQINRHRDIENIGFVFDLNGKKIFHCGDTNPLNEKEYATFSLNDERLDLAFLERLFFSKGELGQEIINKYIAPQNIILMHIGPNNNELFFNHFKEVPHVKIFREMMEENTYNL